MNQNDRAWAAKTADIAGFASPWVTKPHVRARAYPVALNFSDALKGFKGKRKSVMFHMANRGEAGKQKCLFCGGRLDKPAKAVSKDMGHGVRSEQAAATKPDEHSTWHYVPGVGVVGGMHYLCSWGNLLGRVHVAGRVMAGV